MAVHGSRDSKKNYGKLVLGQALPTPAQTDPESASIYRLLGGDGDEPMDDPCTGEPRQTTQGGSSQQGEEPQPGSFE